MAKYTNISDGPRGAYLKGVLIMADPGQTIDADDAPKDWFKAVKGEAKAEADGALPRNVPKLKALARKEEIDVGAAKSADDLIAAIEAGRKAKEPAAE